MTAPQFLDEVVQRWAALRPDAVALVQDERTWTYGTLWRAIEAMAARLRASGVGRGDRVLLVGENSLELAATALACARLRAWVVLVNARLTAPEIAAIAAHAGPRLVVWCTHGSPAAAGHAAGAGGTRLADDLLQDLWLGDPDEASRPAHDADDPRQTPAVLVYTSGTTGHPKGVMLAHASLLFIAERASASRQMGVDDVAGGVLPLTHVYGFASMMLATLYAGGSVRLFGRFDPERLRVALATEGITVLQGVPTTYARYLEHLEETSRPHRAPSLRFITAGGSPIDPSLKAATERAFGLGLNNGYGLTECSPSVCQTDPYARTADVTVGRPLTGVEVRLVAHDGTPCAPGEVGELRVRGPNVMLGYYRAPDLTDEVIDADGWFHTGDLALRRPADGQFVVVGRLKELIIRSGFNVYPSEVEAVLNEFEHVTMSAVIGHGRDHREEVVAFVESHHDLDVEALRRHARARLAPYKVPTRFVVVSSLPTSSTGKVAKARLGALLPPPDGTPPPDGSPAPDGPPP